MPASRTVESHAPRAFVATSLASPVLCPVPGGTAAAFTRSSPDRRDENEDAAAVIPYDDGSTVLVVADGMGGRPNGADAARMAVEAIRRCLSLGRERGLPLRSAVLDGIERANRRIQENGNGAGATLAVAQIREGNLRPYHVGDAFVLLTGQRGKIKLQTVAHSPVGYALESGLMDEKEALSHEQRHFVSNMLGAPDMHITVGPSIRIAPKDTIVVGSDGLADNFPVEELVERVRTGPIDRAAEALAAEVWRRMVEPREGRPSKPDDITFILFRPRPTRGVQRA